MVMVKFMQMTHYQFCCRIVRFCACSTAHIFASFQRTIKTNILKESPSCILKLGAVSGNCKIIYAYMVILVVGKCSANFGCQILGKALEFPGKTAEITSGVFFDPRYRF